MPARPPTERPTLRTLQEAREAGRATISFDEAWPIVGVSRAAFYRAAAKGEVPGVLRLGRKRLLALGPFLGWLEGAP